jgi:hypothetical protein
MACPLRVKKYEDDSSCPISLNSQNTSTNDLTCPNSDPSFNKIIGERTPEERSKLFIICIIVRALLYYGVYVYKDVPVTRYIVGTASVVSMFQLSRPTEDKQWWSKKFQLVMATFVLMACILSRMDVASYLLFASLMGGIIQRMFTSFC